MSRYLRAEKFLAPGLAIIGGRLWTLGRTRKAWTCEGCCCAFPLGTEAYRPLREAAHVAPRFWRACRGCVERR